MYLIKEFRIICDTLENKDTEESMIIKLSY